MNTDKARPVMVSNLIHSFVSEIVGAEPNGFERWPRVSHQFLYVFVSDLTSAHAENFKVWPLIVK